MTCKYYKKYENKLLIAIFDEYIKDNGTQLVALDAYQFSSLDPNLFIGIPQITLEKIHSAQNSDSRYLANLVKLGFVSYKNTTSSSYFYLTPEGYLEALKLKSPITYFCKKHWKFLLSITLAFIGAITALIRLSQCT